MTIPLCSMYLQQVVQDSTEKNRGYRVLEIANRSFEEVVYIFLNIFIYLFCCISQNYLNRKISENQNKRFSVEVFDKIMLYIRFL